MSSRHEQLSALFLELRSLPVDQRADALERARAASPGIAADVESMLRHEGDLPPLLMTGQAGCPDTDGSPSPAMPERIGPYRVVDRLGAGGMGEVYLAEQGEPLPRQVAVKIIRSGDWHGAALARFRTERHALARMDHLNIAHVFEAGASPDGDPYFAMEFVDGPPITEYCDRERLPLHERLDLFLRVCAGVQHAHQRAILHRDLKPGNVLVTTASGQPIPKIIDFGVAKPLDDTAQGPARHRTGQGVLLGTPGYMSPEQAAGDAPPIDTRADIYSLGAMLYELLCGAPPVELRGVDPLDIVELRRRIREQRPRPPSRRVTSHTTRRALAGDLDQIVMKAIDRDPDARYGSVVELAADVTRYRNHEPVGAVSPGRLYRLRKALRRHRLAVGVAAMVAALLIAFSTVALVQANRALDAQRQTEELSVYMTWLPDISAQSDFFTDVTRREYLNHGENLARSMTGLPLQRANLLLSLAGLQARADDVEHARQLYEEADASIRSIVPPDRSLLLRQQVTAALLTGLEGDLDRADASLRELIGATDGTADPVTLRIRHDAMRTLNRLHSDIGRRTGALDVLRTLTQELEETRAADDPELLVALGFRAAIEEDVGNSSECLRILRDTQPRMDQVLGPRHPATRTALFNLAVCSDQVRNVDDALAYFDEAVERGLDIGWEISPRLAMYSRDEFGPIYERFRANRRVDALGDWAGFYIRLGEYDRAVLAFDARRDATRRVYGADAPEHLGALMASAAAPILVGRFAEAEAQLIELLAKYQPGGPAENPNAEAEIVWNLVQCRVGLGDPEGARKLIQPALEACVSRYGEDDAFAHLWRATLSSLDRDRDAVLLHVQRTLEALPITNYSPERDVVFEWLHDDPEFLRVVDSSRHPFLIR